MKKARNAWRPETGHAASDEPVVKLFVTDGVPVKVEYYRDGTTPKESLIPAFDGEQWGWKVDNDYINLGIERGWKPADAQEFRKALTKYKREHRFDPRPGTPHPHHDPA